MARRRRHSSLFPTPRRSRRRSTQDDAFFGVLVLIGGGVWFSDVHPAIAASVAASAALLAVLVWRRRRARTAAYREALLECGIRDPMQLSPIEFEDFCALLLGRHGWEVKTTKRTGDYGADILATRSGVSMVVQCKRYAKAVGVSAVQEAHAALSFYGAQRSAVMATRGFTKAAQSLADSTGTALIVPGSADLGRLLGGGSPAARATPSPWG